MSAKKKSILGVVLALVVVAAVVIYFVPGLIGLGGPAGPKRVILISIDTCRADFLGCYNPERSDVTPNLDALAKQATLFRDATSPVPITLPSHCSMFTGVVPPKHGVRQQPGYQLRADAPTIPMLMELNGYATGGFVSASVLDGTLGLGRGFDVYDDEIATGNARGWADERSAEDTTALAMTWIARQDADDPFFLFVHYYDAHLPYEAPAGFAERFGDDDAGRYAAELAYIDHWIGKLLEDLKKRGLYDSSLIIVTADHGEMLGEHGENGHQFFIYEPAIKVPLIIKMPGQLAAKVVTDPVGLIDLAPTIVSALRSRHKMRSDGRDLMPYLTGDQTSIDPDRMLYCESVVPFSIGANPLFGLSGAKWKYIETTRSELYDLQADPDELINLITAHDRVAREFSDEAVRIFKIGLARKPGNQVAPKGAGGNVESLGYFEGSDEQPAIDPKRPDPKDLIKFHDTFQRAVLIHAAGRVDEALAMCLELVAEKPDLLMAQILLTREYFKQEQFDKALAHCDAAVAAAPTKATEYVYRAGIHEKLSDEDAALADYTKAIELDIAKSKEANPNAPGRHFARPGTYLLRAKLLVQRGEMAAAIEDLQIAAKRFTVDSPDRSEAEALLEELMAEPRE